MATLTAYESPVIANRPSGLLAKSCIIPLDAVLALASMEAAKMRLDTGLSVAGTRKIMASGIFWATNPIWF